MQWLVEGKGRPFILQEGVTLWGCSERTVDDLTARARKEFRQAWEVVDRKDFVAQSMAKFDNIYEKSLETRQLAVAHAALAHQLKILGLGTGI